jgi:hypothetical protein
MRFCDLCTSPLVDWFRFHRLGEYSSSQISRNPPLFSSHIFSFSPVPPLSANHAPQSKHPATRSVSSATSRHYMLLQAALVAVLIAVVVAGLGMTARQDACLPRTCVLDSSHVTCQLRQIAIPGSIPRRSRSVFLVQLVIIATVHLSPSPAERTRCFPLAVLKVAWQSDLEISQLEALIQLVPASKFVP